MKLEDCRKGEFFVWRGNPYKFIADPNLNDEPSRHYVQFSPATGSKVEKAMVYRLYRAHFEASEEEGIAPIKYESQSAQDAMTGSYGDKTYWDYLEQHAKEIHDKFLASGEPEKAKEMLTRSLGESLVGNDGI